MENQNIDSNLENLTKKERKQLRREQREKDKESRAKSRKAKSLFLWLVVLGVLAGVVFAAVTFVTRAPGDGEGQNFSVVAPDEWIKGNSAAPTTLIEYGDFQCPACGNYYPIVKRLAAELGDDVRVVYRHFPLKQIHDNAEMAARAAEAAGLQDRFWDMHDMIFENQSSWSNESNVKDIFSGYAGRLELDLEKFEQDLNSKEVKDAVNEDLNGGLRAGVNSTPTFVLNGKKISPPRSYEDFQSLLLRENK